MQRISLAILVAFIAGLAAAQPQLNKYVNPLIGTHRMGHTYPGATVPFGSVQLSPETDTLSYEVNGKYNKDVYKYCAGYQYQDKTIVGFAHTHFSGTGHSDLGDFLIMPTTGPLQLNPGTADNPTSGYRSPYSHATEVAAPNYYKVDLDRYHIKAEMTTTARVGFHQYTFPGGTADAHIILDAEYGIYNYPGKNVWTYIRVENDHLITGYRQTNGWAKTRTVYFATMLSKPITEYGFRNDSKKEVYRGFWRKFDQSKNFPEIAGPQIKAWFSFGAAGGDQVKVKFAISPVSTANALENLYAEAPNWDFDEVKATGQQQWEAQLARMTIEADEETKKNFYTAVYHTYINPTVYMDVNKEYRGLDQQTHKANGFTNYTTFSLWDTYRALHPLFHIIQPSRNADMIRSMLAHYDQSAEHMLPVWSNSANENWCMIGYHAVPVVADAVISGNSAIDGNAALNACVTTAKQKRYDGLEHMALGYVPEDKSGASVSKTLEYAYDDWCIAQMARKLNRSDIYDEFIKRSQNWRNVYDASIGYMRPRMSDGAFKKDFDVLNTDEAGFIEGNAWNYSLYVPHEPAEMIKMMGGKKRFTAHLDSLFTMQLPDSFFAHTEDITRDGIIGNYVHGNEPSHHAAYLYNWTDAPWKTQERVRMILKKMYHPTPDGLGGNDDCGQMSAWYIFSTLGFYPVAPGSGQYALGSPAIDKAVLKLENGNTLTITAQNQSDRNVYVQKVLLNGKPIDRRHITYDEIMKGGELVFVMSGKHR